MRAELCGFKQWVERWWCRKGTKWSDREMRGWFMCSLSEIFGQLFIKTTRNGVFIFLLPPWPQAINGPAYYTWIISFPFRSFLFNLILDAQLGQFSGDFKMNGSLMVGLSKKCEDNSPMNLSVNVQRYLCKKICAAFLIQVSLHLDFWKLLRPLFEDWMLRIQVCWSFQIPLVHISLFYLSATSLNKSTYFALNKYFHK